uniref:Uncharacterized protein n=1 Tax=Sphaeramia orbicularis TaxID=375764 RepID=A0A672ZBJ4_9TELE
MQDYEHAVSFLGSWGPFQKRVFILLCFLSFPSGFNVMSVMFLLADPSHHCTVPLHWNLSQDWVQASIPLQEKSSCSRYPLDLIQNLSALGVQPGWDLDLNQSGCEDGWSYSAEFYQSTVVTEVPNIYHIWSYMDPVGLPIGLPIPHMVRYHIWSYMEPKGLMIPYMVVYGPCRVTDTIYGPMWSL